MTTEPTMITTSSDSVARLVEVLEHCDEFLRTTPPVVRAELADFCLQRPNLTSGWLIDMVALHAFHLRTRLAETNQDPQ